MGIKNSLLRRDHVRHLIVFAVNGGRQAGTVLSSR